MYTCVRDVWYVVAEQLCKDADIISRHVIKKPKTRRFDVHETEYDRLNDVQHCYGRNARLPF